VLNLFGNPSDKRSSGTAKRVLAAVLSAAVVTAALGNGMAAFAADSNVNPVCDETYYAMLNYYGNLKEGSVVKSYALNGASTISDYGQYDSVNNLSDDAKPSQSGNKLTFNLNKNNADHFYFEGKTSKPYASMPWTLKVSYRLNGVAAKAEDLAGKSGLVEINIDATPKKDSGISSYYKNNLVLMGTTAFNEDDILSLEANGAQVQLLGNLRSVLFLVMPGETQHVNIRVGTNSFTFSGMTFMAVPATLSQLNQITDLQKAKNKTENSYKAIQDSLDSMLGSADAVSGSLNTAADGIDQLNQARASLSSGKTQAYQSIDVSLADLSKMADSLQPMNAHLDTASKALSSISSKVQSLSSNMAGLKTPLENCRKNITAVQKDLTDINALVQQQGKDFVGGKTKARGIMTNLQKDMNNLGSSLKALQSQRKTMQGQLKQLSAITAPGTLKPSAGDEAQLKQQLQHVQELYSKYMEYCTALKKAGQKAVPSFDEFLGGLVKQKKLTEAQAKAVSQAYAKYGSKMDEVQELLSLGERIDSTLQSVNSEIATLNTVIGSVSTATSSMLNTVSGLCSTLGDSGIIGELKSLNLLMGTALNEVAESEQKVTSMSSSLTGSLKDMGNAAKDITKSTEQALSVINSLTKTINSYVPDMQNTLKDCKTVVSSATTGMKDTASALKTIETLAKSNGGKADAATQKALQGLSQSLRGSSRGFSQTDTARKAQKTISDEIDKQWDTYTGEKNNLLYMNPNAKPVSMTSTQNSTPHSIQMVIRTQEIKESDNKSSDKMTAAAADTTFPERVANLFKGIWGAITGVFVHK